MVIFQKLIIGTTKEEYWSDQKVNLYLIFKFAEIFCDSKYSATVGLTNKRADGWTYPLIDLRGPI